MKVTQVYIQSINNLRADCSNLIQTFKSGKSQDFKTFCTIWIELKFNVIYEKYMNCHEFKEDSLQIAKEIMLNDHFVGGLCLLFGLYYVQDDPKACIRLESDEFQIILHKVKEDRGNLIETFQPGVLLAKLLKNAAFSFVVFSREFSIEGRKRASLIFSKNKVQDKDGKVAEEWLKQIMDKSSVFEDLRKVEQDYAKIKTKIKEEHPDLNLSLNITTNDFVNSLLVQDNSTTTAGMPAPNVTYSATSRRSSTLKVGNQDRNNLSNVEQKSVGEPSTSGSKPSVRRFGGQRVSYFKKITIELESEVSSSSENESDSSNNSQLEFPDI